ncbi:hypothetical protein CNEO4_780020 [Clostridium neonatale]|nr:hypothetical protein CNEO4_780020 [Clostridium neonatale]CAI3725014.1 hypothetical protein CNEO4_850020 [Clostridium neonatale]
MDNFYWFYVNFSVNILSAEKIEEGGEVPIWQR